MTLLLKAIEHPINTIAGFSSHISQKPRKIMMNISLFVLLWNGVVQYCNDDIKDILHFQQTQNVSIYFLIALLVLSIEKKIEMKKIQSNILFLFGWFTCFGFMLLNTLVNPVHPRYYMWSIVSMFVFPILFLVWSYNDTYIQISKIAAFNTVLLSYIFFIASAIIVPFISKEKTMVTPDYLGMAQNPNNNGMVCTAFFGAALYMFFNDKKNRIMYLFSMGVSLGISVIAVSRTAVLAIILEIALGVSYYIKGCRRGAFRTIQIKQSMACIAIVLLLALISGFGFKAIDDFDFNVYADSGKTIVQEEQSIVDALNQLSSGRIDIWKAYVKEATFLGNGSPKGPVIEGNNASRWAHNNALDILYISGVLAFIGYIIWITAGLVFIARNLFYGGNNISRAKLFTIIMFVGYFTQAMLEITIYPFNTNITLLAYIGIGSIAFVGSNKMDETCE